MFYTIDIYNLIMVLDGCQKNLKNAEFSKFFSLIWQCSAKNVLAVNKELQFSLSPTLPKIFQFVQY